MNDSDHLDSYLFGLSKKDIGFTLLIVFLLLVSLIATIYVILQPNHNKTTDTGITFSLGVQIAVLLGKIFTCFYIYKLFKNVSFYYLGFCWLAHTVYKFLGFYNLEAGEYALSVPVIAILADVPLFLSAFPAKERKWYLIIFPLGCFIIAASIFIYGVGIAYRSEYIFFLSTICTTVILIFLIANTYLKNIFELSRGLSFALIAGFFLLFISQLQFLYYDSLCPFYTGSLCTRSEATKFILRTLTIITFLILFWVFLAKVKYELTKAREERDEVKVERDEVKVERDDLKVQLKVKSDFEILGYLAGAVEHELRNPLQAVTDEVEGLLKQIENKKDLIEKFGEPFQDLEKEVYRVRAAANTINILRFNREDFADKLKETKVIERINSAVKRVKIEFPKWADNIASIEPIEKTQDLHIQASFIYLEQTFLNFLKNSYEAIIEKKEHNRKIGKGKISIELDTTKDGKFVLILFKDEGTGFNLNDLEILAQPTYTRKRAGNKPNGGLGLFVCDKIVYLHDGIMYFSNNESGGAAVRLIFPRYFTKAQQKVHTTS